MCLFSYGKTKKRPDPPDWSHHFSHIRGPYRVCQKKCRPNNKMTGTKVGATRNPWIQHLKASYTKPAQRPEMSREPTSDASLVGGTSSGSGALEPTDCSTRNRTSYKAESGTGGSAEGFQQTQ